MPRRSTAGVPGSSVFCHTPPPGELLSAVKSSFLANGSRVEPSKAGSGALLLSVVAISVTRWSRSASRFTRVMEPGVPDSWPWKTKCVP